jgi:hypothetical protein
MLGWISLIINQPLSIIQLPILTRVCFKDGFEDTSLQPVLMFLNPAIAGYFEEQTLQYDATAPTGEKYFLRS